MNIKICVFLTVIILTNSCNAQKDEQHTKRDGNMEGKMERDNEEWKKILPKGTYCIMREKATEAPFTGKYYDHHEEGTYLCAACGQPLFKSDAKFNSGSGWPSFFQPCDSGCIAEKTDTTHGMIRTEVLCAHCGGHLGHVFDDGPKPTGLRYCINSAALDFRKK